MSEILAERAGSVLTVQLTRPAKKNAITTAMYVAFAEVLEKAAKDDATHVVLVHGAGDSFTAGNDLEDFVKNPPGPGESPQMRLFAALNGFDKPIVAAVHGVAVGFGTTMLVHCDFVYAGESARFITPFIDLALVPEMGSSYGLPGLVELVRELPPAAASVEAPASTTYSTRSARPSSAIALRTPSASKTSTNCCGASTVPAPNASMQVST